MNRVCLNDFINHIEELAKVSDKSDYLQDSSGRYNKVTYLEDCINEAKRLIAYGESQIALENMLENLNEVSIQLDKDVVKLARQAFGMQTPPNIENLLSKLTE